MSSRRQQLLLEIDRRTQDAHDLVAKLRRYWEWGRLLQKDADKHTVNLVRSRLDAIDHVDHKKGLWRRVYPPTGREGLVPVSFVFADTAEAKVANTIAVLEDAARSREGHGRVAVQSPGPGRGARSARPQDRLYQLPACIGQVTRIRT